MAAPASKPALERPQFIDLFSGCGGFSLGFCNAGWKGIFAIERDRSAFSTFARNFLQGEQSLHAFSWPDWLPKKNLNIRYVLKNYHAELVALRGSVDAVIGGPPCQGFSFAGHRRRHDSRNQLFRAYVEFVKIVKPRFVLIENVRGITIEHGKKARLVNRRGRAATPFSTRIVNALRDLGYNVNTPALIHASTFGVPQRRPRVFFFAYISDGATSPIEFFDALREMRDGFLKRRGLPVSRPVHVAEALSDLLRQHGSRTCDDPASPAGFQQGLYGRQTSAYQRLLRNGHKAETLAQSHRFANHRQKTTRRFKRIHTRYRKGVQLSSRDRRELDICKRVVIPLHGDRVGHTLTTLPDDYIHYSEPRILTVREYARLQSFPDNFVFDGPFTTGGDRRKHTCPRYTQIGNAVPPLLAEAIALALYRRVPTRPGNPGAPPNAQRSLLTEGIDESAKLAT